MFKQWCREQGFLNNSNVSHVLMDGGILSVPFDRLNDFYKICIQCIKNGEKIYVVEQKTDNYNFFLDIDYIPTDIQIELMNQFSFLTQYGDRDRPEAPDDVSVWLLGGSIPFSSRLF